MWLGALEYDHVGFTFAGLPTSSAKQFCYLVQDGSNGHYLPCLPNSFACSHLLAWVNLHINARHEKFSTSGVNWLTVMFLIA